MKSNSLYYKIETMMFNSFEMIKIEEKSNKLRTTNTFNIPLLTLKYNKYGFTIQNRKTCRIRISTNLDHHGRTQITFNGENTVNYIPLESMDLVLC